MTDHPILFSAMMVRALLAGTKTQTRRMATSKAMQRVKVGDRLYVREAWRTPSNWDDRSPAQLVTSCKEAGWNSPWAPIHWESDASRTNWADWREHKPGRLRAGMHLPRPYSRLTLFCTGTKVERLQDIGEPDAVAEGIERIDYDGHNLEYAGTYGWKSYETLADGSPHPHARVPNRCPITSYRELWDSLHSKDGERWKDNPEVIALTFEVRKMNIDEEVVW